MVWINALVASGGGQIIENAELGDQADAVDGRPGRRRRRRGRRPPGPLARPRRPTSSTAGEEEARSLFQSDDGGFMVNWPYVYSAATAAVADGAHHPVGRRRHRVGPLPEGERRPRQRAAARWHQPRHRRLHRRTPTRRWPRCKCITSAENNAQYMVESGNPAARAAAYEDPAVREAFPMADLIRESIDDAGPRPITPYYGDVSVSVQRTWHPPSDVQAPTTPEDDRHLHDRGPGGGPVAVTDRDRVPEERPMTARRRPDRGDPATRRPSRWCRTGCTTSAASGWRLSAPAFIVMILVTAYPLGLRGGAVVLQVPPHRSRRPGVRRPAELRHGAHRPGVVERGGRPRRSSPSSASAIELVLGFGFAWVMYRIVRGRSFVRTAILVPYGIITVVSAFVWRYAFQADSGFVNQWFGLEDVQLVRRALVVAVRHHAVGDLEDDAVHLAAAARRSGAGARASCSRRPRSTAPRPGSGCGRWSCPT